MYLKHLNEVCLKQRTISFLILANDCAYNCHVEYIAGVKHVPYPDKINIGKGKSNYKVHTIIW